MRYLLIAIIAIPLTLGGGGYGYVWYSAKQQANRVVDWLAPIVRVEYDGFSVSPFGQAKLSDLSVRYLPTNTRFLLDSLTLNAPSILELTNLDQRLSAGDIPGSLDFALEGLRVNLDQPSPLPAAQPSFALLGCRSAERLDFKALRAIGYDSIKIDATARYTHNALMQRADVGVEIWAPEIASVQVTTDLPTGDLRTISALGELNLKLSKAQITYTDLGFNDKRNLYCAQQNDSSLLAFLARHAALAYQRLVSHGVKPNEALVDAYRQFSSGANTVTAAGQPFGNLTVAQLDELDPQAIIDRLGLDVSVNESPVRIALQSVPLIDAAASAGATPTGAERTDARMRGQTAAPPEPEQAPTATTSFGSGDRSAKLSPAGGPAPVARASQAKSNRNREHPTIARFGTVRASGNRTRLSYRAAPATELPRHVGRRLIVETRDGQKILGTLQQADTDNVAISMSTSRGIVIRLLHPRDIRAAQIGGYH